MFGGKGEPRRKGFKERVQGKVRSAGFFPNVPHDPPRRKGDRRGDKRTSSLSGALVEQTLPLALFWVPLPGDGARALRSRRAQRCCPPSVLRPASSVQRPLLCPASSFLRPLPSIKRPLLCPVSFLLRPLSSVLALLLLLPTARSCPGGVLRRGQRLRRVDWEGGGRGVAAVT